MPPSSPRLVFAVLSTSVVAFSLVQSMSIPVVVEIARHYDTSATTATWVVTSYLLSAAVATPLLGRWGDSVGKQRVLVLSLLALSLGSFAAAVAPTIGWLLAARVVQGLGGGVLPLAFGLVRDVSDPRTAPARVAAMNSLMAVGMALGIVVAGPLLELASLAALFLVPGVVTLAAAGVAARMRIRVDSRAPGGVSAWSAVWLAAWLVLILVGVTEGPVRGWLSAQVLLLIGFGIVAMGLWVRSELRARVPLVDLAMLRLPVVRVGSLVAVLVGFGGFAAYAFVPQYVQVPSELGFGFGASASRAGLVLLPAALATFAAGLVTPLIARRVDYRGAIVLGGWVASSGAVLLVLGREIEALVAAGGGVLGFGVGVVFSGVAAVIVLGVAAHQTGVAAGMNANLRTVGGAIGAAVLTSIVAAASHPAPGPQTERGFVQGFTVLAVAFALAGLAARALPASHSSK